MSLKLFMYHTGGLNMFWKLVLKEIKYQFKSITFYVFLGVVLLFYSSQFGIPNSGMLEVPKPNQERYGSTVETDKYKEMRKIYYDLQRDLNTGQISKYILGIYKGVNLSEKDKSQIKNLLDKMVPSGKIDNPREDIKVTYDEYLDIIHEFDEMMGGNTVYSDKYRHVFRSMTYQEALNEYNILKKKDKFTNGYGRLFSDYMGITAGLFVVFVAAFVLLRDKKSNSHELIYSSGISSTTYVLAKYIAVCTCIMLGYLVLASYTTIKFILFASSKNLSIAPLAFYKYTFTWIMPTVLFSVSIAMLLSIIFNNGIIAIIVQAILWFSSTGSLLGDYRLSKYIIRFNSSGEYDLYMQCRHSIIVNRIFYTIISLGIIMVTSYIWSKKRSNISGTNKKMLSKSKNA